MTLIEHISMRQRIQQEGARLFSHSGFSAISMREIAAACGISKAALYYHFKDKEDLIIAILTENLVEIGSLIASCRAAENSARGRLSMFMRAVFAQPVEQRAAMRLANQEMANLSPEARTGFGRLYQETFIGPMADILEMGMRSGELRLANPHQAVWVLLGMMYPFFYPNQERQADLDTAIDLMIAVFFDGMCRDD